MIDLSSGVVVGSHNKKKLIELREVLEPLGWKLVSVADVPGSITVDETGTTFIDNARLKATVQAKQLERWTIGEDSGLCVPALGGQPGVYSARYSGENATDESNNRKLLESMAGLTATSAEPITYRPSRYPIRAAGLCVKPKGNVGVES